MARITLNGTPFETSGELPDVGATAPDFRLVDSEMNDVNLKSFAGKKKIISIVPSLDTGVCATSSRRFNEQAASIPDLVVLVVSSDLPFAQKRFCSTERLDGIVPLSLMRSRNFAKDYGMMITGGPLEGITGRGVVCLDENNQVLHSQLVPEIADEPDYEAALAAVR